MDDQRDDQNVDGAAPGEIVQIRARVLPIEEWHKASAALQRLDTGHSIIVVVEEVVSGKLLAEWGAMTAVHVEGLQIYEGGAGVARALLTCMVDALTKQGVTEVLTQSVDARVEGMIAQAGGRVVPGTTWVLPLGASTTVQ